jgi:DNA mismatch endonuclease (patch repair protein)
MSQIHGKDTQPELLVRSALHKAGFRFRLHVSNLPGRPDIVLPRHQTVVQVHGCFWHRHKHCRIAYTPKSNRSFWRAKFNSNVARDTEVKRQLRCRGWRVWTVWQCQAEDEAKLSRRVSALASVLRASEGSTGRSHGRSRRPANTIYRERNCRRST